MKRRPGRITLAGGMRPVMLSRRALLRGSLGGAAAAIAMPTLDAMLDDHGEAFAADGAALPLRFGFWLWCGGIRKSHWVPSTVGANWELKELTMPFAKVKPHIALVTGMQVKSRGAGHHQGLAGMLTGAAPREIRGDVNTTMSKASIDVDVANAINRGTAFSKGIQVGVLKTNYTSEGPTYLYTSFNGPDSFNPAEFSPAALFDRLFKNQQPAGTPMVDAAAAFRRKGRLGVYALVKEDASRLLARVGANDRMRIDEHLASLTQIEKSLASPDPAVSGEICPTLMKPTDPGRDVLSARSQLMSDLLVAAFQCRLTNVFSMHFTSVHGVSFREVGITNNDFHQTTHDEPGDQPTVRKGLSFQMTQLGSFFDKLAAAREGAGLLIDRCAVLATSELTEGRGHSVDDMPIVIAGSAGGKLKTGVHIRAAGENTSKVHLTLLRALGVAATEYGVAEGRVTETLAALEA